MDEAHKWLHTFPYTEECHEMVMKLQKEAQKELELSKKAFMKVPTQ